MNAARYTVELAKTMDAEVVLMHSFGGIPAALAEKGDEIAQKLTEEAGELLEPYRELFRQGGVRFTEKIIQGKAGDAIVGLAEDEDCDIIVIGSRGLSNLERILLGSVTTRVVQMASCPVLVIR